MSTVSDFKNELTSLKDSIGSDLIPALEDLSSLIDESIVVLNGVETHDMDIDKASFKSVIKLVNDEIANFKGIVKDTSKIRFAEIWSEEADNSLRAIKQAEIEEAEAARLTEQAEEKELVEGENIDPVIPE